MKLDDRIARVKELIKTKEEVDAELAALFEGGSSRRGRPPKQAPTPESQVPAE